MIGLKIDTDKCIKNDLKAYVKEERQFRTQLCAFQSLLHLDCNNCIYNYKVTYDKKGTHTYCVGKEWKVK